jgi:hypothetical protein
MYIHFSRLLKNMEYFTLHELMVRQSNGEKFKLPVGTRNRLKGVFDYINIWLIILFCMSIEDHF